MTRPEPNQSVEPNRRPAAPLNARWQFESAWCAPPSLSAAVAHLWRWANYTPLHTARLYEETHHLDQGDPSGLL